jgi:hypothetical protein
MSRAPLTTRRGYVALTLLHNCIVHPLAGVLWLVGLPELGDWLHDSTRPGDRP